MAEKFQCAFFVYLCVPQAYSVDELTCIPPNSFIIKSTPFAVV